MLIVISAIGARTALYLSSVTLISLMRGSVKNQPKHFVANQPNLYKVVVGRGGLEPPTSAVTGPERCA